MRLRNVAVAGLGVLCLLGPVRGDGRGLADFAFLQPWFAVEDEDRETLAGGGVVVRALPADDRQIGVIAVSGVTITPAEFAARLRAADHLTHSQLVSGRFSDPPALADLAGLSLDQGDLDRLRQCRPGDCRLNLADAEMAAVQHALERSPDGASTEAQRAFRGVVLDRVVRYQARGLEALPEYHDQRVPVRPAAIFADLLRQFPYVATQLPDVAAYLEDPPAERGEGESYLRWAKAMINGKAVVMVTDLSVFRRATHPGEPAVLVAGKQVFASRYMNGELTLIMLFPDGRALHSYLVYVLRTHLDTLGGRFGGLRRALLERGIRNEAAEALAAVRQRLERR